MLANQTMTSNVIARPIFDKHAANEGYKALAKAIILRAVRDADGKNLPSDLTEDARAELIGEAQDWLTSADAAWYCEACEMDYSPIQRWVRAGCPALKTTNSNNRS